MKYSLFSILIVVFVSGCQRNNGKQIIGAWEAIDNKNLSGFEFKRDGTVDNKLGFYQLHKSYYEMDQYSYFVDFYPLLYGRMDNCKGNITKLLIRIYRKVRMCQNSPFNKMTLATTIFSEGHL